MKKGSWKLPFVVQEGFEPSQAEPESEVLPLHHWTNRVQRYEKYL